MAIVENIVENFVMAYLDDAILDKLSPNLNKLLGLCFNKAVEKWTTNPELRRMTYDNFGKHLPKFKEIIFHQCKAIHPEEKKLILFWIDEIRNDKEACHIIEQLQIDEILRSYAGKYKDELSELNSMRCQIELTHQNTEELKKIVSSIEESLSTFAQKQFDFEIKCDTDIDVICPIPDKVAARPKFIEHCKTLLDSNNIVHIYGTYKSGKSVLACLLAQQYYDYTKIRVELKTNKHISIGQLLRQFGNKGKVVIIIDGLNIEEPNECDNICRYFTRTNELDRKVILVSNEPFSSILLSKNSPIAEIEAVPLTEEDVISIVKPNSSKWGSIIQASTSGNPQLVQLALKFIEESNYSLSAENFIELFTFSGKMDISNQCRRVLKSMIPDNDSLQLLNRLLLFQGKFTQKECEMLANVEPIIESPLTLLASLTGTWVIDDNGVYEISPFLKKSTTPDINIYTKRDCCKSITDYTLRKKALSSIDILDLIALNLKCGSYEKVAEMYIYTILYLNKNNLMDSELAKFIKILWYNMPLPEELSINSKIAIRSIQLSVFGLNDQGGQEFAANDLLYLLASATENTEQTNNCAYQILSGYYLISGNITKYKETVVRINSTEQTEELTGYLEPSDLVLFQLSSIKDYDNLVVLMESLALNSFKIYDLFVDGVNCAIKHIIENKRNEEKKSLLNAIVDKSRKLGINNLYPFAVSALSSLMQLFSADKDIETVRNIYNNNTDLLAFEHGHLQMNYSFAIALEENGHTKEAPEYYIKASEIHDLTIASTISLRANIIAAKYLGDTDPQNAVGLLCGFMRSNGFNDCLTNAQRMVFFGTLSIAYWFNKQFGEAMKMNNIIMDYVWQNKDDVTDELKEIVIRQGAMLTQYLHLSINGKEMYDSIPLNYELFVGDITKIIELYSSKRIMANIAITSTINDIVLDFDCITYSYAQKAVDYSKDNYDKDIVSMPFMSNMIPLLLKNKNWDSVEYMMVTTASSIMLMHDRPKDSELAFLYSAIIQIISDRYIRKFNGEYVDDERIWTVIKQYTSIIDRNDLGEIITSAFQSGNTNYQSIENDNVKTALYIYNIDKYSSQDMVVLMYRLYVYWHSLWKQHSLIDCINTLIVSIMKERIRMNRADFNLQFVDLEKLIKTALAEDGYESTHKLIIAYNYILKNPPTITSEIDDFLNP